MDINPLIESNIKLKKIEQAVRDLHYALDMRQHGGVAEITAMREIQDILDLHWFQGEEKKRRDILDEKKIVTDKLRKLIAEIDDGQIFPLHMKYEMRTLIEFDVNIKFAQIKEVS